MAREILSSLGIFTDEEINLICNAIYNHSCKEESHSSFSDVLVDADVLQHCLYNPFFEIDENHKARYEKLKKEFGLLCPIN